MYPVLDVDLKRLESTARCGDTNRTLESYLMLPVQRITILPLLIDAVGKNVDVDSDEREACFRVGNRIRQIVSSCNERTREIQLREEMLIAGNQLEFDDVPSIGLVTHKRWLVKKGPVKRQLESRISYVDTYHRPSKLKILHKQVWIFLFIDLIIIARRRKHVEDERYKVLSYCQRNMAVIFNNSNKIPEMVPDEFDCKGFQLCLLQNHENLEEEMILLCEDEDTRNSWVELLSSKSRLHAVYPKVYQEWDCPQMRVIMAFEAEQPTDLGLNVGELVDVREKRSDGWCYGVKSDNVKAEGWFPRDHVEKVASVYERAKIMRRNYQRRRRMLLDNKENSWKKLATFYMDE